MEKIAHYEQYLNLSQCFQKSSAVDASKSVYKWERVKLFGMTRPGAEPLSSSSQADVLTPTQLRSMEMEMCG